MKQITLIALVCTVLGSAVYAVSVPLNGGFERAELREAENWQTQGPWVFKGLDRMDGRRSAGIRTPDSLRGDRMVAKSGMLLTSEEPVTLSGHYTGGPGFVVGLELIDRWGTVSESVATEELPEVEDWT
ncbi:MAG: hypothetical protein R6V19_12920, partial [Armatimonadota bacterium]